MERRTRQCSVRKQRAIGQLYGHCGQWRMYHYYQCDSSSLYRGDTHPIIYSYDLRTEQRHRISHRIQSCQPDLYMERRHWHDSYGQ